MRLYEAKIPRWKHHVDKATLDAARADERAKTQSKTSNAFAFTRSLLNKGYTPEQAWAAVAKEYPEFSIEA